MSTPRGLNVWPAEATDNVRFRHSANDCNEAREDSRLAVDHMDAYQAW
jgi:hypothetical protein